MSGTSDPNLKDILRRLESVEGKLDSLLTKEGNSDDVSMNDPSFTLPTGKVRTGDLATGVKLNGEIKKPLDEMVLRDAKTLKLWKDRPDLKARLGDICTPYAEKNVAAPFSTALLGDIAVVLWFMTREWLANSSKDPTKASGNNFASKPGENK